MNVNQRPYPADESDEAQLTAYALDQLDAEETAAVEALLADSPEAQEAVREIRATGELIRQSLERSPKSDCGVSIREAVEQRLDEPASVTVNRRRSRRRTASLCTAAACVGLVIVGLSWMPGAWNVVDDSSPEVALSVEAKNAASEKMLLEERVKIVIAEVELANTDGFGVEVGLQDSILFDRSLLQEIDPPEAEEVRTSMAGGDVVKAAIANPALLVAPASGATFGYSSAAQDNDPAPVAGQAVESMRKQFGHDRSSRALGQHNNPSRAANGVELGRIANGEPLYTAGRPIHETRFGTAEAAGTQERGYTVGKPEWQTQRAPPEQIATGRQLGGAAFGTSGVAISADRRYVRISPSPLFDGIEEVTSFNFDNSPGTEQYEPIIENPFVRVLKRPVSTFSIDVDTASYANVRRFLNSNRLPPPNAVRVEEMVNYFRYNYDPPKDDGPDSEPFSVHMETAECPWNTDNRLLRVGLKGREIDADQRGPSNIVFLLDVSGSMRDANKLPLVKQAMLMLGDQLTEDDRLAIVTYAASTGVVLKSTCGDKHRKIRNAIEALSAGGSTHGSAGIQLAYRQAAEHFVPGGANRVILCTDGDLNVGIADDDELVELITQQAKTGVFLTVLGFGTGNLKDGKLEKLADHGNGMYAYLDTIREAQRVLVEQVAGSLITIAKDVKIQVEFNPALVQSYRLVGYENRVMAARDFDNDKKDAGEIGAGHTVTAFYEIVPADGSEEDGPAEPVATPRELKYQRPTSTELTEAADSDELLTLRLRYKQPEATESVLREFIVEDSDTRFGQASDDFRFAASVASFGMMLRHSQHAAQLNYSAVEEFAAGAVGEDTNGFRAEFVELIHRASELDPR